MELPVDDVSVPNDVILWRRILPRDDWLASDRRRPSSMAFRDGREERNVSTHRADMITLSWVLAAYPDIYVAAITAGDARAAGYAIVPDPQPDDPSHTLLAPPPAYGRKALQRASHELAIRATWVVAPEA